MGTDDDTIVMIFEGLGEAAAEPVRELFADGDDEVVSSNAFGGAEALTVITKLAVPMKTVLGYFQGEHAAARKTEVSVNKAGLTLKGFTAAEVRELCGSKEFRAMFKRG